MLLSPTARASFIDDILSSTAKSSATPLVDQLLGCETTATALDDAVEHWIDAQQEVEAAGAALADAQQTVGGASSWSSGGSACGRESMVPWASASRTWAVFFGAN